MKRGKRKKKKNVQIESFINTDGSIDANKVTKEIAVANCEEYGPFLDYFSETLLLQRDKGLKEYGQYLEDNKEISAVGYLKMAMEELVDGFCYLVMAMILLIGDKFKGD